MNIIFPFFCFVFNFELFGKNAANSINKHTILFQKIILGSFQSLQKYLKPLLCWKFNIFLTLTKKNIFLQLILQLTLKKEQNTTKSNFPLFYYFLKEVFFYIFMRKLWQLNAKSFSLNVCHAIKLSQVKRPFKLTCHIFSTKRSEKRFKYYEFK